MNPVLRLAFLLNSLEEMLSPLKDLYRHAHDQVVLRRLGPIEQGRHLHAQAALFGRTLVNLSAGSECPVWLDRVANAGCWVYVWQFAPTVCISVLRS